MTRKLLLKNGYNVEVLRALPAFIEAVIKKKSDAVLMQWTRDSAFRFFPLVKDELFGLALHPFDLATNKILAMVGRLEVRDWIDVIYCHDKLQNTGYLFWAACGKDAGFNPKSLLVESKRSSHYSAEEIGQLSFLGPAPDSSFLGEQWRSILKEAEQIIDLLPSEESGACVLDDAANLFIGGSETLKTALQKNAVRFHRGSIKGAYPKLRF